MEKNSYDIFVSYRRTDEFGNISGRDQARLIAKQLQLEGYNAFFDYSEIRDDEFDKVIIPAVENCMVFILVLTKDSLNRCKNDDDWVRREVETAIKSGSKIINVSPDNTFNGWPLNFPESMKKITTINISEINFGQLFEVSINKLIDDRISQVIPRQNLRQSSNDLLSQFDILTKNLYLLTIKYREAINLGKPVDNVFFRGIQKLVKKVYSISEVSKFSDTVLSEKSKTIVNHYNMFVDSLRQQFSSDRDSEEFNHFADKSSEKFANFVDAVVKAIDTSKVLL